jgi:hypothetical protein
VVLMIIAAVAVFAFGIAMIRYLLVRGSKAERISDQEFDDAYDELVADGDREAARRDFHTWQLANEEERLSWEEPSDE